MRMENNEHYIFYINNNVIAYMGKSINKII